MSKPIILIDLDEVVFDFDAAVIANWEKYLPGVPRIESNELKIWNLPDNYSKEHAEKIKAIWREKGFFRNLKPIEGATDAVHAMLDDGYKIFLCSTPTTTEPYCMYEKLEAIYEQFGERLINNVIFTKDKTLIKGDYLIDDKPQITGVGTPTWTHIFFDRGRQWGKEVTGPKLSDWSKWREVIN